MEGNVPFGKIENGEMITRGLRTVEANSYRTRGEPVPVVINGVTSEWHSLKGGLNPERDSTKNLEHVKYEVLFNPDTNTWLKIVPPEKNSERAKNILKKSVTIARAACVVANLPELADKIEEHEVEIRGKKVYGFESPHMGQSIEYYAKEALRRGDDKSEIKKFISNVYDIALQQAIRLLEEYGYWTDDPNPGNILLHQKDDEYHVLLIDFSNRQQEKSTNPESIPPHVASPDQRDAIVALRHKRNIEVLHQKFIQQCEKTGGVFSDTGLDS